MIQFLQSGLKKFFKLREKQDNEMVKPFLDHLEDFRWMIIKMVSTLMIAMILSFCFRTWLAAVLQYPLQAAAPELVKEGLRSFGVIDSMMVSMKLAFYAGIVLSLPILLYFLAEFVLPGLKREEKKYIIPAIFVGAVLFMTGVLTCYYMILPRAMAFLYKDAKHMGWHPDWSVSLYYSFVTQFVVIFGLLFELPVVVIVLVKMGLLTFSLLNRTRSYAIVIIFFLGAVIAPSPDLFTYFSICLPMYVLYEACIWIAWFMERSERKARKQAMAELAD